jgi:dCMP deaminase
VKNSWREYFFKMACFVATKSKDPSTKVGCVLVGIHNQTLSTGFNGFARGVNDSSERYEDRSIKLQMIVHAEANAIAAAARSGIGLFNHTAFITMPPCPQCAALLIQAGVSRIVCPVPDQDSRWFEQQTMAIDMCKESNVRVEFYE